MASKLTASKQKTIHLSPASYVILVFGGIHKTARAVGADPGSVSRWRQPKEKRGTGGSIPSARQQAILKAAAQRGLDITADDLVNGRRVRIKAVTTLIPVAG